MLAKLVQSGGLNAIARQLRESPPATMAAAHMLMPGLLAGLRNFPGGIKALLQLFDQAGGVGLAQAIMGPDQADPAAGEAIIGRIGGIALAPSAGDAEGAALRLRVAPLLAMLVVGYLSARAAAGGVSEAELAQMLVAEDVPRSSGDDEPV